MIRTETLKTKEDAMMLLMDQQYNEGIKRYRSNFLFRGIPDSNFKLETSLRRNCADKQEMLEMPILNNFTKYALNEEPGLVGSVWNQMIVGQHYGLPTRLLDWTHSVLIALHFATSETDFSMTDKRDGIVWRIDAEELSKLLPQRYQKVLALESSETFTIRTLSSLVTTTAEYDLDMQDKGMVIIEPPSTDQRIINQYSYFSIMPLGMTDIEGFLDKYTRNTVKYVVDRSIRWDVRDILDQLNVSERIVYPGLDGLSKWVARHYYVKK